MYVGVLICNCVLGFLIATLVCGDVGNLVSVRRYDLKKVKRYGYKDIFCCWWDLGDLGRRNECTQDIRFFC